MYQSILTNKIHLRKLELKDAAPMLNWMQNPDIYCNMQYKVQEQSLKKCEEFIKNSWSNEENMHWAVADREERYLGTVSLKNIDKMNLNAEFAIVIVPEAMGKEIGLLAMAYVMEIAFYELGLHKVYLYVREDNERAVKFYQKHQLSYEGCFREQLFIDGIFRSIHWYGMIRGEFEEWKKNRKL